MQFVPIARAFLDPPTCPVFPDPVEVFYDNVVKSRGVGIRASCFSTDPDVLVRLMVMHGLSASRDAPVDELQYMILCHLVVSDCYRSACTNRNRPSGSCRHIVCTDLSDHFPSATDMSMAFLRRILDDISSNQKLNIQKISALAAALTCGYSPLPFCAPAHTKCDAMRLFARILKGDSDSVKHSLLPVDSEKMSKSELVCCAHDHSIQFDSRMTVSDFRALIVNHILSVSCLESVDMTH